MDDEDEEIFTNDEDESEGEESEASYSDFGIDPYKRIIIDKCAACIWGDSYEHQFEKYQDGSASCIVYGGVIKSTEEGCDQYQISFAAYSKLSTLFGEDEDFDNWFDE